MRHLKIAIVHEWLEHYGGSERVLGQLLACYPQADVFAVVDFMAEDERAFLGGREVTTTFIQYLPFARRCFRRYLQLMPIAIEQLDLSGYDLVISSHHAVAKGVITGPDQLHISYVHSPMRYAWDMQAQYLQQSGLDRGLKSLYAKWMLHSLRGWDRTSAAGVDVFIANSSYIARRIRKAYRRNAHVLHPPVAVDRFVPGDGVRDGYLVVSRLVPYKRIDLIVEAFAQMPNHRLTVVGDGPGYDVVAGVAARCKNIELLKPVSECALVALMQRARAMVFAAEEDFGITMVEAQACGTPIIAYGAAGACDIISSDASAESTGVLFPKQSVEAIIEAVRRFEALEAAMSPQSCRANAMRFSENNFRNKFCALVAEHEHIVVNRPD